MTLSLTKVPAVLRTFRVPSSSTASTLSNICSLAKPSFTCLVTRYYAIAATSVAPKKAKAGSTGAKIKEFPVETDPYKLVNYCCGLNYFQEGEEVKLKPDSEYPDWLYKIHIGRALQLNELDPNTKLYWEKVKILAIRRNIQIHRYKTKVLRQFK